HPTPEAAPLRQKIPPPRVYQDQPAANGTANPSLKAGANARPPMGRVPSGIAYVQTPSGQPSVPTAAVPATAGVRISEPLPLGPYFDDTVPAPGNSSMASGQAVPEGISALGVPPGAMGAAPGGGVPEGAAAGGVGAGAAAATTGPTMGGPVAGGAEAA